MKAAWAVLQQLTQQSCEAHVQSNILRAYCRARLRRAPTPRLPAAASHHPGMHCCSMAMLIFMCLLPKFKEVTIWLPRPVLDQVILVAEHGVDWQVALWWPASSTPATAASSAAAASAILAAISAAAARLRVRASASQAERTMPCSAGATRLLMCQPHAGPQVELWESGRARLLRV